MNTKRQRLVLTIMHRAIYDAAMYWYNSARQFPAGSSEQALYLPRFQSAWKEESLLRERIARLES